MILRCQTCSHYIETKNRKRDLKCPCGGEVERMTHVSNGTYKNWKFELYKWEPPKFVMV